jgi:hypothetical protein
MPKSSSTTQRVLRHTRAIHIQAYAREDGLWDLDAHISDIKTRDIKLQSGLRMGGQPLHDLLLRVTIDTQFNVKDASAVSNAVPYHGHCEAIAPDYKKLTGLNLMQQFRQGVKERFGGVSGCTHLNELAQILPTAAVQAFAGDVFDTSDEAQSSQQPFELDRCHALRTDGAAVAKFYPRWAKKSSNANPSS